MTESVEPTMNAWTISAMNLKNLQNTYPQHKALQTLVAPQKELHTV